MLKSNSNRFWSFFRNKTKVKHYLVRFKTILLALQTHKVRRVYYKSVFKQVDEREQDQLPDTPIIFEVISVVCVLMISTSLKFYLSLMLIKRVDLIMSPHMY